MVEEKTQQKTVAKTKEKKSEKVEEKATSAKSTTKQKQGDFAVIETGGKQYVVAKDDVLTLEKITGAEEGSEVTFDSVLLSGGKEVKIGTPRIDGAKVTAKVLEVGKGKKILVSRFKAKSRHHRRYGHRQPFTKVQITDLNL